MLLAIKSNFGETKDILMKGDNNRGRCERMDGETGSFLLYALLIPHFFIIHHLVSYTCLSGMYKQLPSSSWVLLTFTLYLLLHTFSLSSCLSPSFIYPLFGLFFILCLSLLDLCHPNILFDLVHYSSSSNFPPVPAFFSRHVCDPRWSPPLVPLLLISSAHGPVFCCRPNPGQNRT